MPQFDGIYWDTWEDSVDQFEFLVAGLKKILKKDGVFSWFNHPEDPSLFDILRDHGFVIKLHKTRIRPVGKKEQGALHYFDARYKYYNVTEARWS